MANTTNPMKREEGRPGTPGQFGTEAKGKAQEAATTAMDKAKDTASAMTEKAKDVASSVAGTAGDVASAVGHRAEDAASAVGGGMKSLAGTIREKGPHGGMLGSASTGVADALETGGRYLQEEGLSGMAEDLTNVIRRNPLPAVLIGIGIGFLLARATRS